MALVRARAGALHIVSQEAADREVLLDRRTPTQPRRGSRTRRLASANMVAVESGDPTAPAITVAKQLARRAQEMPDSEAIRIDSGASLTFHGWESRSNAIARGLRGREAGSGARVLLVFNAANWIDFAVSWIAVHKAGAQPVLLPAPFRAADTDRVSKLLSITGVLCPADLPSVPSAPWVASPAELEAGQIAEPTLFLPPREPHELFCRCTPLRQVQLSGASTHFYSELSSSPGPLTHTFVVGTPAAQAALRLSLMSFDSAVFTFAAFDASRLLAVLATNLNPRLGLSLAQAAAIVAYASAAGEQIRTVKQLIVDRDRIGPRLAQALARTFPLASTTVLPAAFEMSMKSTKSRIWSDLQMPPADARTPPNQESAPASFAQEEMLWREALLPGSFNFMPLLYRIAGSLDVDSLKSALNEVVLRHEVLRTNFEVLDGSLLQVIQLPTAVSFRVLDLSTIPFDEQDDRLSQLVRGVRSEVFDLVAEMPFTAMLVRFAALNHVLIIRVHHSVFDAWSVGILIHELSALYYAFATGNKALLPEPTVQFREFARTERQIMATEEGARQLDWWRRKLAGAQLTIQLPLDDPSLPAGAGQPPGNCLRVQLSSELAFQLRAFARNTRATVFMTMLAAFCVVLKRYTGQEDVVVPSTFGNRERSELGGVIGCFASGLPLRIDLSGDPTFSQLVSRTRAVVVEALAHHTLPYERLWQEALGGDAAVHGLRSACMIAFQALHPLEESLRFADLEVSEADAAPAGRGHRQLYGSKSLEGQTFAPWGDGLYLGTFLLLSICDQQDGIACLAEGSFHPPACQQLLDYYHQVLAEAVREPLRLVSNIGIPDEVSHKAHCNPDPVRHRREDLEGFTAGKVLAGPVERGHDRLSVTGGSLTCAALDARSRALAEQLSATGIGTETPVGTCLRPSLTAVVVAMAIWRAGGVLVPLPADGSPRRLRSLIGDAGIRIVVGDTGTTALLRGVGGVDVIEADGAKVARTFSLPEPHVQARQLAYLSYGDEERMLRRGVGLTHYDLCASWAELRRHIFRDDRGDSRQTVWCLASSAYDTFVRALASIAAGQALEFGLVDKGPQAVVAALRERRVDGLITTPTEVRDLLEVGLEDALVESPAPVVLTAETPLDTDYWRYLARAGTGKFLLIYGPPEVRLAATLGTVRGTRPNFGRPLGGITASVVDRAGRRLPPGVVGELELRRSGVGSDHPAEEESGPCTASSPRCIPAQSFRTSQLARVWQDGFIEILGGIENHVELRGYLVQPKRIAASIARGKGVAEAAVILQEDQRGAPSLLAKVRMAEAQSSPDLGMLRRWVWSSIPGYAWPAAMQIVPAVPLLLTGRECSEPRPEESTLFFPASGVIESSTLLALWSEVSATEHLTEDSNYWQQFSFLEAVSMAYEAGIPVSPRLVTVNRTIGTLGVGIAALAASRVKP